MRTISVPGKSSPGLTHACRAHSDKQYLFCVSAVPPERSHTSLRYCKWHWEDESHPDTCLWIMEGEKVVTAALSCPNGVTKHSFNCFGSKHNKLEGQMWLYCTICLTLKVELFAALQMCCFNTCTKVTYFNRKIPVKISYLLLGCVFGIVGIPTVLEFMAGQDVCCMLFYDCCVVFACPLSMTLTVVG